MRAKTLLIIVVAALFGIVAALVFGEEGRSLTGSLYRAVSGLWEDAKPRRGLGLTFDAPADVTVLGLGESRDPQSYSRRTSKSFGGDSNFQLVHLFPAESSIARLSRGVGRISLWDPVNLQSTCTGTLISADYILTAAHCFFVQPDDFAQPRDFKTLIVRFHLGYLYEKEEAAVVLEVEPKPVELVCPKSPCTQNGDHDPDFEYAILKLAPNQYERARLAGYDFASLGNVRIVKNHQFAILHHPLGREMVVSERHCLGAEQPPQEGAILFDHSCDTEEGTSGAPIFSRDHGIVAGVHVRGMEINPPGDRDEIEPNQGIHIQRIAERSKIIGEVVEVNQDPLTQEQQHAVDYANQRGEESTALLADNRSTLSAYVALSGLEKIADRTRWGEGHSEEHLIRKTAAARMRLANALYASRELADLPHKDVVIDAKFSPDGSVLMTLESRNGPSPFLPVHSSVHLWASDTGRLVNALKLPEAPRVIDQIGPNALAVGTVGANFSPNEHQPRLVTWSTRPGAQLWNAKSGAALHELDVHEHLSGAVFSRDGKQIVTWPIRSGPIRLINAETGKTRHQLAQAPGAIFEVAFNPDGRRLAISGPSEREAWLWDTELGKPLLSVNPISGAVFSPHGNRLVTESHTGLQLRDATTGSVLKNLEPPPLPPPGLHYLLSHVAFSHDGTWLVTGAGKSALVWNGVTGEFLYELQQPSGYVKTASFSRDSKQIVTWGDGGSFAFVWNLQHGKARRVANLGGHEWYVGGAIFSADGSQVATWQFEKDASIRLWDLGTCTEAGECAVADSLKGRESRLHRVAFNRSGSRLVSAAGNSAHLWYGGIRPLATELKGHTGVEAAKFNSRGSHLLTHWPGDRAARLWSTKTGASVELPGDVDGMSLAEFSPDDALIVTWSRGERVGHFWNARTGQRFAGDGLTGHDNVPKVVFAPKGSRLVTWLPFEKSFQLWNTETRELERKSTDPGIEFVSFNADGQRLLTWSPNGRSVRLWNGQTGAPIRGELGDHSSGVWDARFSPQGDVLATLTIEQGRPAVANSRVPPSQAVRSIQLWDAATATRRGAVTWTGPPSGYRIGLPGTTEHIVFDKDGRRLLAWVPFDQSAVLWRLGSQTRVQLKANRGEMHGAQFSPDGSRIVTWTASPGSLLLWDESGGLPEPRHLLSDQSRLAFVMFSPDSSRLFALGDKAAWLWDARTGALVAKLNPGATMGSAAFSADSTALLTLELGGDRVRLWSAATGALAAELHHKASIFGAKFNPDKTQVATWSLSEGAVKLWSILGDDECLLESAYARLRRVPPTASDCQQFGIICGRKRLPRGDCIGMGRAHVRSGALDVVP